MTIAIVDGRTSQYVVIGAGAEVAGVFASQAKTSATAAQNAANSASAAGRYFTSLAAGEAGSTTGQFFSHPDGLGNLFYRERTVGGSIVIAPAATKAQIDALGVKVDAINIGGLAQLQPLMTKFANKTTDINVVLSGDSTGDATSEWYYLTVVALAAQNPEWTIRYRPWNDATSAYPIGDLVTIQTGTGGRIATFWNASVSGSVASHHAGDNFNAVFQHVPVDLVFLSYGHNGGNDAIRQLSFFSGIVDKLSNKTSLVPVVIIGQNPTTVDTTMAEKVVVLKSLAGRMGYGFIDIHHTFLNSGVALATLMADTVHPNLAGSQIWRDAVLSVMKASKGLSAGSHAGEGWPVESWLSFSQLNQWTKSNATATRNITEFETLGESTNLANIGVAAGWISKIIISGDDIIAYRGKYVTLTVWQRVPVGNGAESGRIDLEDSAGTTQASGPKQGVGFVSFSCTRKIDEAATFLRAYIYPTTGATVNTISVDRVELSVGLKSRGDVAPQETIARTFRVQGSGPNGVGTLYNANTSTAGLRYLLLPQDDPATDWVSDFKPDGFAVKLKTNTVTRYAVTLAGFQMGPGNAALDMGIDRQLAGLMRFSGGDIVPSTNGLQYVGTNGQAWRAVLTTDGYYVQNNLVVGPRLAALPADATDLATAITLVNAIKARLKVTGGHGLVAD